MGTILTDDVEDDPDLDQGKMRVLVSLDFTLLSCSESNFSFLDRLRDVLEVAAVVADHHLVAVGAVISPIWTGRSITRQNSNYALESTVLMMKQLLSLK